LPRSLDKLAKALEVEQKDSAGTTLINLFCKPRRGKRTMPEDEPEKWAQFVEYCRQDVVTLRAVHQALPEQSEFERLVWLADQRVNDAGIKVDLEMAEVAVKVGTENAAKAMDELRRMMGISNPNSVIQFKRGLAELGLALPDLQAETIETALVGELEEDQRRALVLRQESALVAAKKYQAALTVAGSDGRVRGQFLYFGAHTGRWSSRGIQVQNMPREQADHPEAAILDLKLGLGCDAQTLKKIVRQMLVGPFTVVDYSAIEARALAWVAGEKWALEAFAEGRDIYVETAKRMGVKTRQQGKVAVLALGYQGGPGALRNMGAEGSEDKLQRMKHQWRRANPRIVRLWYQLEEAFKHGGKAGRLSVEKDGSNRLLVLPSGRPLVYREVRAGQNITFQDPRGYRTDTYGGRLVENAVQAIQRELLAHALVELVQADYPVVLHVHDEIAVEGVYPVEEISKIMCDAPSWADGLPISAEGHVCQRYSKG
jgi:DNA polymerase